METLTPTETLPAPDREEKRQSLMDDLKERRPRAWNITLWKMNGFDVIPTVDTLKEASALADQGLPSYVTINGHTHFAPELLIDEAKAALAELKAEFIASEQQRQEEAEQLPNRLKSVSDMLKTPEIDWLVEDKIHRSGLCQIFGASYAGKTLLVLDLIMSWCAGLPEWQGYKLNNDGQPQEAVYVAAEGGAALSVHVDAWLKYHADVDRSRLAGLLFLDGGEGHHMFLGIGKTQPDAEDSFPRLVNEINEADITPSLIVFDTQIDLAPGIDENSNTDMVGVLRQVKRLADSLGFMAIVIHHTGHDGNKARGASGMMGKCDAQAKLTTIGEGTGKAKLEWMKVKGRALPKDSISYEIKGWEKLPDLDSEGAVCVPLSKMETAIATQQAMTPSDELQRKIFTALNQTELSGRAIADAIGMNKDSKELKDALTWMVDSVMIEKTGKGPRTAYVLSALAVAPSEY